VILLTGVVAMAIWAGLIGPQRAGLKSRIALLAETRDKVKAAQRSLSLAESFAADLAAGRRRLERMESGMPTGDVYRWAIRTFTRLQTNRVQVINLAPPRLSPSNILPKVPYETATFSVSGRAYYHDFGEFLASLENGFPHMRLRRLELEATHFGETDADEQEKLNFKMEIAALVRSAAAEP
jgi:hypothetical protein